MTANLRPSVISAFLWFFAMTSFVIFGLLFVLLSFCLPPKWLHPVAKWVCGFVLLMAGQRLRQIGDFPPPAQGPYIYVFNHTSLLDTFILIALIPEFTGAIGKAEQFKIPIWGWILRRWGAVPIQRRNLSRAIDQLGHVEAAVKNGRSLLISPEGTRSLSGRMLPFKKGPFHVALNTNATIVPMSIIGAYRAKRKNSWLLKPNCIEVRIAESICATEPCYETIDDLRAETMRRIAEHLPIEQRFDSLVFNS